jgi:MFS family permease
MNKGKRHRAFGGNDKAPPSQSSLLGLDSLNFLMADVRDGVGPYLSVFLKGSQNWQPAHIGMAMAASSIAAAAFQIPAGLLVDALKIKRLLVAISGLLVALGCLLSIACFSDVRWLSSSRASNCLCKSSRF